MVFILGFESGLRAGEIAALRWSVVIMKKGFIKVSHPLLRKKEGPCKVAGTRVTWPAPYDGSRVEPIGAAAGSSAGTTITASGSTNVKGSYAQLIAATADPIDLLLITPGAPSAAADYLLDIAVGGADSEQIIISNLLICSGKASGISANMPLLLPLSIPAGTRISARAASDVIDATDRLLDVVVYGVG